ncbi:hypothetical protein CDL15_Pgr008132 [Punica granatum]|uniref:Uncharacterized protein n=1 Tax=Punica granatum TaxID=22663 RepID=A0A218VTH7_PUNGR|nr:hypothetical protein CDL15_Pgr008132 [Punica granatum]PKI37828.1 hypothetical protein CRG98_041778 [Punica granatum]
MPCCQEASSTIKGAFGFRVKATSGVYIGIQYLHVAADGRAFAHFMRTWASLSRAELQGDPTCIEKSKAFLDRTVIKDPYDLEPIFLKDWRNAKQRARAQEGLAGGIARDGVSCKGNRSEDQGTGIQWRPAERIREVDFELSVRRDRESRTNEWIPGAESYDTVFGRGRLWKKRAVHIDAAETIGLTESRDGKGGVEIGLALHRIRMYAFSLLLEERAKSLS